MNERLKFRPDLLECMLEERVVPAIANLGFIAPTTSGLILLIPFPGANASAGGSLGASGPGGGTASSVSGAPVPGGFFITGVGGISSMAPGNLTGVPSFLGAGTGSASSSGTIQVGSGAESADAFNGGGSSTATLVSRNVVADPFTRPIFTTIGGNSTGSSAAAVLPPGQSYRDTAPVAASAPLTTVYTSAPASTTTSSGGTFITNPYAPTTTTGSPAMGPTSISNLTPSPLGGARVQGPATMPGVN
jgi:hypothetical protein